MTTSYRDAAIHSTRTKRGTGSIRQRSPGVWEIRVVVGFDTALGRSVQRSFTVHGDAEYAQRRRREFVDGYGGDPGRRHHRRRAADHRRAAGAVLRGAASVEAGDGGIAPPGYPLLADPLALRGLAAFTPGDVRAAICRWQASGVSVTTVSARWLVLRSALSWAVGENILGSNPLAGIKGPPRPMPRLHHTLAEVRLMLRTAEATVDWLGGELAAAPASARCRRRLFSAEQTLLLVRLAADSGARRGELAALRHSDLDGRILSIERGLSRGVLGSTKTSRNRRMTLDATTAALIEDHFCAWDQRAAVEGDWLFAPTPVRATYVTADSLSHKFRALGRAAGVESPALHRLRHGVATHLVDKGKVLKAQARFGHRDPATTLRHYAHAVPLDDLDVADDLDALLNA